MAFFGTVYGVTGHMLEHQKHVYCVQFRVVPLQEMDTSKIAATRGERFKKV